MSNIKNIEEDFQRNVKDFEMKIELDQGVHRSILFVNKNGSSTHHFRLNTWHNHLCISGDMGDYVFCRLPDMFEFFRNANINPRYWGGKLTAIDNRCGYLEPCIDSFRQYVNDRLELWLSDANLNEDQVSELNFEINDLIVSCDDAWGASVEGFLNALRGFNCQRFSFDLSDLSSSEFQKYTINYLWCLHAIVCGIEQYDKFKAETV